MKVWTVLIFVVAVGLECAAGSVAQSFSYIDIQGKRHPIVIEESGAGGLSKLRLTLDSDFSKAVVFLDAVQKIYQVDGKIPPRSFTSGALDEQKIKSKNGSILGLVGVFLTPDSTGYVQNQIRVTRHYFEGLWLEKKITVPSETLCPRNAVGILVLAPADMLAAMVTLPACIVPGNNK